MCPQLNTLAKRFDLPASHSNRLLLSIAVILLALSGSTYYLIVSANNTAQALPFSQDWTNAGLITADDNWNNVPGIVGYRGDGLATGTGVDPQTIVVDGTNTPIDVNANETSPNTLDTGGVAEFDGIANRTIALQGSGTADAPFIIINLNTTGSMNVTVAYNLRDIDGSADNAVQRVALQYRAGNSGNFTNLPAGFVADATTGPNLATQVTAVNVTLPAAADNQPLVQVRIITTNAANDDEWVGIDDIRITGTLISFLPVLTINDVSSGEGNTGTTTFNFTVSLSAPAPAGGVTFNIATQDNTATTANSDYAAKSLTAQTITAGNTTYTFSVNVNGDNTPESNESFFVNVTNVNGANVGDGQSAGTILDDDTMTLIHDIQGSGETPNFNGQVKTIRGIVVGDFQGAGNLNGFFVEEEQSDWDANTNTSEGIFIFGVSTPNVNIGDQVTVTGTVTNFPASPGLTELTTVTSVVVNSTGNALPPAQAVSIPVSTSASTDLEKYEGMRITFGTLIVTDNSSLGQFGELGLASGKLFIPTNSIDPNDNPATGNAISGNSNAAAVTARQMLNDNSRIVLDDGKTGSNPNPIPFIGAGTNSTIRLGDSVSNLAGVLSFGFGSYRLEPTSPPAFTAVNPRPVAPAAIGRSSLRVASFNVENYFVTTGTGRGPNNAAEHTRKRNKVIAALAGLNADVIGLIELEKGTQATANAAAADLVNALNTLGTAGSYAVISTPAAVYHSTNPVGTDTEIKSGIIYRVSSVTPVGNSLTDISAAPGTYSRAPIAQSFQSSANGAKFTVVVNHLRSKSCAGTPTGDDLDQGTGQGCFNGRRRIQTQALVNFINTTLVPLDPDVLLVGDLNAYGQEDPIDVLRAAGLTDLVGQFIRDPDQYSFPFQGQVGRLDHAFSTPSLTSQTTGAAIWHINTDEPLVFDYNTENKPDDRYAATPFRSADHDPVLIGLNLVCEQLVITPETLPAAMKDSPYSQVMTAGGGAGSLSFGVTSGALPDGLTLSAAGLLSGTPTKAGIFNFTVTAVSGSCSGSRSYTLIVSTITSSIEEPAQCVGPGVTVRVTAAVTNSHTTAQSSTFTASLQPQLLALPGTCTVNVGSCTVVNASTVTWSGTLGAGQTLVINYQAQVADDAAGGAEVCVTSTAKVGAGAAGTVKACTTLNCSPLGPGILPSAHSPSSGQRAGSVLIYNIHTSEVDGRNQNTRVNITNVEPRRSTFVHLFFIDSNTCTVADYSFCLSPSQTLSFLVSEFDPGTTGYLVAVAVDKDGCPANFNYLIGDEYVKFSSGHAANLNAEAVPAIAGGLTFCDSETSIATLAFDGVSYGVLPHVLAVDGILSRDDGNDTLLILNRIGGNLGLGVDPLGRSFGLLYDDQETARSFGIAPGGCQYRASISSSNIRTVPRLEQVIPAGRSGWMRIWQIEGPFAMTGAVLNFNPNASASADVYNQGHNLHTLTTTSAAKLMIPVFPPNC
jgi:predicted extracellular nuclease